MKLKLWPALGRELLRLIAKFSAKADLLPHLLFIADKWGVKRQAGGGLAFPFVKRMQDFCFQVLVYHRVNDGDGDPVFSGLPVRVFKDQMQALSQYFNVFSLEELVQRATSRDIPPRAVAITFDDGYRDNYENAFPILKEFGLPATVFLTTGAVNTGSTLWHDLLFDLFRQTNVEFISIEGKDYPLRTPSEREAGVNAFRQCLRRYNYTEINDLLSRLRLTLGVSESCIKDRYLSWHDVEEMSKSQISFGAHTVSHPILTRMPLREAADEIINSRDTIEKKLGSPVRLFAYPNGNREDFNDSLKRILHDAGFVCAVTILWGVNDAHTDPFELRRVALWDSDPKTCALRLAGYRVFS